MLARGPRTIAKPEPRPHVAAEALLHPVSVGALSVLVLNDHWWKAAWPGVVTGKLSDFAGLIFFPLFLLGVWEIAQKLRSKEARDSGRILLSACIATGIAFALIQVWSPASEAYRIGLGAVQWGFFALGDLAVGDTIPPLGRIGLTPDPSDLVALVSLPIAWTIGRRHPRKSGEPLLLLRRSEDPLV